MSTQALERTDQQRTPAVITTPDEYVTAIARWKRAGYHVLSPFANMSGLAERHGIISTVVKLDLNAGYGKDAGAGEVYGGLPFLSKGQGQGSDSEELAIAKIGLRKLAEAGAISTTTVRTDPRTIPYYWEFKATATYRGIDGATVTREATVEWDLRDGSPRLKGWRPDQINEGRKNGLRNCETRAINAAIREFGIRQKYTRAELAKPFVVVRVAYQPDLSDPLTRQILIERSLGGTAALYPSRSVAALGAGDVIDADPVDDVSEPRQVGSGTAAPATSASTPPEDVPPTEDAVRIERIDPKSGTNAKSGRKWTRYTIVDSRGVEHSTFSQELFEVAERARVSRQWVEVSEETDGQYTNLVEILPAGQQPSLLPDDTEL